LKDQRDSFMYITCLLSSVLMMPAGDDILATETSISFKPSKV
jgi:hypothetical protein